MNRCPGQNQHSIFSHPSSQAQIMSSFLGIESSHDLPSIDGLSGRTGSSRADVPSLSGGFSASFNPDESTTTVSTHNPKGDLTEPTGPPQHLSTFGRTGGMASLWMRQDPNNPTSGGYSRTAKRSTSSPSKKPESPREEQATPMNGQQS